MSVNIDTHIQSRCADISDYEWLLCFCGDELVFVEPGQSRFYQILGGLQETIYDGLDNTARGFDNQDMIHRQE